MKITVSFKHLDHTEALDERIHEKTSKLGKYLGGNTSVNWTCYVQDGNHWAELNVHGPTFDYHAKAKADSMYKTLDLAIGKVEKQIKKKKEKWKDRIHHKHETPYKGSIDVENGYGEDYVEDVFKKVS